MALEFDERSDVAAAKVLKTLLGVIEANSDGTITDIDSEFLHDYRVSVRRSRSVQRELRPSRSTTGAFGLVEMARSSLPCVAYAYVWRRGGLEWDWRSMGIEEKLPSGFLLTSVEKLAGYMRKGSLWPATFGLACCAIEMMATGAGRYDLARSAWRSSAPRRGRPT